MVHYFKTTRYVKFLLIPVNQISNYPFISKAYGLQQNNCTRLLTAWFKNLRKYVHYSLIETKQLIVISFKILVVLSEPNLFNLRYFELVSYYPRLTQYELLNSTANCINIPNFSPNSYALFSLKSI